MSLLSLMIAMSVSSGVLLTSVSLLHIAREDFQQHHQTALLDESAAFALEIIARTLQQAVQIDADSLPASLSEWSVFRLANGAVQGQDNARITSDATGMGAITVAVMNGNDVLAVSLRSVHGDVISCAGLVVPAESVWMFFHVVTGPDGEPELHCRYRGEQKWESQAILSGVEYFQLLYGLDTDEDGLPNQYLSAAVIRQKDAARPAGDLSLWRRVVAVHVVLVLRSPTGGSKPLPFKRREFFGPNYADDYEKTDPGTHIDPKDLTPSLRTRARRHVDAVIFLQKPGQTS